MWPRPQWRGWCAGKRGTLLLIAGIVLLAGPGGAQLTLFELTDAGGRHLTLEAGASDLDAYGWAQRASSFRIDDDRLWELCRGRGYVHCEVVDSGSRSASDLSRIGLDGAVASVRPLPPAQPRPSPQRSAPASARVVVYEGEELEGLRRTFDGEVSSLTALGWGDRIRSLVVEGGRWEVCQEAAFSRCTTLRGASRRMSLAELGVDRVRSLRPIESSGDPVSSRATLPRLVLYSEPDQDGKRTVFETAVADLTEAGHAAPASARISFGSWDLCREPGFRECVRLDAADDLGSLRADFLAAVRSFRPVPVGEP